MLTFFAASNLLSLKLSVYAIIDDVETVSADSQRTNVGHMKKISIALIPQIYIEQVHLLCSVTSKIGNLPSLKLSVSAIIDDAERVGADSQRTNVGNMKKISIATIP